MRTLIGLTAGRPIPLLVLLLLLLPAALAAQAGEGELARQSLRPYAHVFAAYALAWLLIGAWAVTIGRRLSRLERRVRD